MKELLEHLSGVLIVSELDEQELQNMLGFSERKAVAQAIRSELEKIEPGTGKIFGAFHTDTEAMKFRRQIAARARDLQWYQIYGQKTAKMQWKTPYRASTLPVKEIDKEKHPEFAEVGDELFAVLLVRFPLDDNHPA